MQRGALDAHAAGVLVVHDGCTDFKQRTFYAGAVSCVVTLIELVK